MAKSTLSMYVWSIVLGVWMLKVKTLDIQFLNWIQMNAVSVSLLLNDLYTQGGHDTIYATTYVSFLSRNSMQVRDTSLFVSMLRLSSFVS